MDTGGSAARADLRGGVGWMVFGLAILVAAWRMDRFEAMGGTVYTAPGLVPALFGAVLMLLGAVLAWRGQRRLRAARAPLPATTTASASEGDGAGPGPLLNRRTVGTLVLTLGYAIGLVGHAPFAASTALFVGVFTAAYAESGSWPRRLLVGAVAGVLTALVVVLVFEELFLVRLP
jgi:hypothetical protein